MPVDAFTGLAVGAESGNPFPGLAQGRPAWAPSPLSDVHTGGAVMWVGGAGLIFAVMMTVFFAWTREARSDGGLGWLETARRANSRHAGRRAPGGQRRPRQAGPGGRGQPHRERRRR